MDSILRDARYAIRRLRQTPGFTAIVVLTLALGIGANTALFSVVNTVLLRPLPYRDPGALVTINHYYKSLNDLEAPVSAVGFRDYRTQTKSFESVAVETGWAANLTGTGDPERIPASQVSGDFFRVYGVQAQLGRTLLPGEDAAGKNRVVVLGDGLWRRVYGAERSVVGRTMQLNGENYQIVGVMPPDFHGFFGRNADLWTPLVLEPDQFDARRYTNEWLNLTARLKPGVSIAQARSEMTAFANRLKQQYPDNLGDSWTLRVTALDELMTRGVRPVLLVLLGAVGFVLLIACANVANLLLARAAARTREIAIRSALGADRSSIVRQLLTESVLLSLVGAALGLALAWLAVRSLAAGAATSLPRATEVGIDATVLGFTLAVAVGTGLLFGLAPALHVANPELQETLREGGRAGTADRGGQRVRRGLVVFEMALALMLLVGAGLLIKSAARLQKVDPGFRPEHLLTFNLSLPDVKYASDTSRTQLYTAVLERLAATPGVVAAGGTTNMPFGGNWSTGSFSIEGRPEAPNTPSPWGDVRRVTPDFFRTIGAPLRAGRFFTPADVDGTQRVVIIDDELARQYFAGQNPLGRRIYRGTIGPDTRYYTIVGVVGHTMHEGLDAKPRVQLYYPYSLAASLPFIAIAVRTTGDPLQSARAVAAAVHSVDKDLPLSNVKTMDDLLESSLGQRRLTTILLGSFAAIALLLAAIGIYGVMSYSVTQRSKELGIRMALGAARQNVLGLVLGQGMGLAVAGIVIGVIGAFALTRLLAAQLYSVTATDPTTFALVALALAAIALLAALLPALRATRVDPLVALREE